MKTVLVSLTGKDAMEYLGKASPPIVEYIIGIGFLGWIVTMIITGRVIASLFWPIWLILILKAI